jgi:HD-GYP domain-containing protein (c-di-GMP phosphodiesterase class II)
MVNSRGPRAAAGTLPADPVKAFVDIARRVDASAPWSAGHSERVARISRVVAAAAGWEPDDIARLSRAAELHDTGKLCAAPELLCHEGSLDAAARAEIELHPALGANMLATVLTGDEVSWVRHHHERWDGAG